MSNLSDMNIDTDSNSDDENMSITDIPPDDIITTNIIINTLNNSNTFENIININSSINIPHMPVFNPIISNRTANRIMDLSASTMTPQEIINAQLRLREMLAGDD